MAFSMRKPLSLVIAAAAISVLAASALAMSSGGGPAPGSGPSGPSNAGSDDSWSGTVDSSSLARKPSEYRKAMKLINKQQYADAIPLLEQANQKSPNDPDILNELGFAYRETGDLDKALAYYDQALQIDPDHAAAREYLGELYLKQNLPKMADIELTELKRICARGCEARKELEKAIADYQAAHPA
jgi:tetratricopeptide (TPR) repeat protein